MTPTETGCITSAINWTYKKKKGTLLIIRNRNLTYCRRFSIHERSIVYVQEWLACSLCKFIPFEIGLPSDLAWTMFETPESYNNANMTYACYKNTKDCWFKHHLARLTRKIKLSLPVPCISHKQLHRNNCPVVMIERYFRI